MGYQLRKSGDSIERDRWGRPKLPDPHTGKWRYWTRPSTMKETMSDKFGLNAWERRMVVRGLGLRSDLYALAAATPLAETGQLDKVAKDAKEAAEASRGSNLGTALHTFTEHVDLGQEVNPPAPWNRDVDQYRKLLQRSGLQPIPDRIERMCYVPGVDCCGSFDRQYGLANYTPASESWTVKADKAIGDVKTGQKIYDWLEHVIQLAIYSRATHLWHGEGDLEKPPYGWQEIDPAEIDQNFALIIHLPAEQAEGTIWEIDVAAGWEAAMECVTVRNWRKRKGLATAGVSTVDVAQHMREHAQQALTKVTPEKLCDLIVAATDPAQLVNLWREHRAIWRDPHTHLATKRQAKLAEQLPLGDTATTTQEGL